MPAVYSILAQYLEAEDFGHEFAVSYARDRVGAWLGGGGVNDWYVRVPLTLAEGIADGRIPADAIDYSTGAPGGGAFLNAEEWLQAGADQDKPLALGVDVSLLSARRLARGIYGYGAAMPKITFPLSGSVRTSARLTSHIFDAVVRGVEFVNAGYIFRMSRECYALKQSSGAASTNPPNYIASNSTAWTQARAVAGNAITLSHRVAEINFVGGAGDIDQIKILRGVPGAIYGGSSMATFLAAMEGYIDGVSDAYPTLLSAPVVDATVDTLAAAINADTATHGFTAHVDGDRVLLATSVPFKEPLRLLLETTGTLELTSECRMAGLDVSCCKFTDCNVVLGSYSETSALGELWFLFNVGRGSWGLIDAPGMRRTFCRVANNDWGDCQASRPAAPGRTSSRMPAGGGTSGYNTFVFHGTNNYWVRSLLGAVDEIYEHNYIHDGESIQNSSDMNSGVGFDLRAGHTDAVMDNAGVVIGQSIIRWNKIVDWRNLVGHEDCNAVYAKPRGLHVLKNWIENCGAAAASTWPTSGMDGSECTGVLIKESLSNSTMPQVIVAGNVYRRMPGGIPLIKVDYQRDHVIEHEDIAGWENRRNGVVNTDPAHAGLIRVTGAYKKSVIRSIRIENVDLAGMPYYVNWHNLIWVNGATQEFHNLDLINDGVVFPEYTGDLLAFRHEIGSAEAGSTIPADRAAWYATWTMGRLLTLNAAGSMVGKGQLRRQDTLGIVPDNNNAALDPFDPDYDPTP